MRRLIRGGVDSRRFEMSLTLSDGFAVDAAKSTDNTELLSANATARCGVTPLVKLPRPPSMNSGDSNCGCRASKTEGGGRAGGC